MTVVLFALSLVSVPDVFTGPAVVAQAALVDAPIAEVTVFSDRARVRRTARARLGTGPQALRFPDLPGAVLIDTVRMASPSARVLRIETTPVERERISIERVDALLVEIESLSDRLAAVSAELETARGELSLMDQLRPSTPIGDERQTILGIHPDTWRAVFGFRHERTLAARVEMQTIAEKHAELREELARKQAEVRELNLGGFSDRKLEVLVVVQGQRAGTAELVLEYFVPGASWKPTYELHFEPAGKKVTLKTAGIVQQATGETWKNVRLELSTAIPGQGIEAPKLLTWTLGEKREFIPRPRPQKAMAGPQRFSVPTPQPVFEDAERVARLAAVRARLGTLQQMASMDQQQIGGLIDGRGAKTGALYKQKEMAFGGDLAVNAPPPPPSPSPRRESRDRIVAISLSADSESADSGSFFGFSGSTFREPEPVTRSLALRDARGYRAPNFTDRMLPAVLAGGLDYVYAAPVRATVPSTGEQLSVPLASESFPVKLFYEATPSLASTAYLRAAVRNRRAKPILAGPANIFVRGDFVAEASLKTTGPGGDAELPLGADEDIRITHTMVPATKTEGVFSKEDVTVYTVTIEIGNYKKHDVRVKIFDQLPKTRNEEIEISLVDTKPLTAFGPDAKGILGWEIDVPAGKTTTIMFRYQIERPADWQLRQQ